MGQGVLGITDPILTRVGAGVGTPAFVYSAAAIRERYHALTSAIGATPHHIHYAVKANSNLAVLDCIRRLGAGADIVSVGELRRVSAAGFAPERVVFSGVGKSRHELAEAVRGGIGLVNLESAAEFDALVAVAGETPVRVGIRVNPDVTTETHPYTQTGQGGMKFGVPLDQVDGMARAIAAAPNMTLASLGMHLGSQISDIESYRSGASRLEQILRALRDANVADTIVSVDIGGGLGVRYTDEEPIDLAGFAEVVAHVHAATGRDVLIEPGRFLVGNAGVLLTRVLYRKHAGGRDYVIVDGGMNDFLRPALYRARHDVSVVGRTAGDGAEEVDVVGPICETGDFLALGRVLPPIAADDLIAIGGAGAYGFVMSSNYNSRARAAEVMVENGKFGVVRPREQLEHLWADECVAPRWRDA